MHNKLAPVGEHTLADYDAYVEAVHEQYNPSDGTWSAGTTSWTSTPACATRRRRAVRARGASTRSSLRLSAVPAAERRQTDAAASAGLTVNATHFYTGRGSLAWGST